MTIGRVAELEYVPTGGYGRRADRFRLAAKKAQQNGFYTKEQDRIQLNEL
jgi:hypothetical protein